MKERFLLELGDARERLEEWGREHSSVVLALRLGVAVVLIGLLAYCLPQVLEPDVPALMPPTDTPTPFVSTHVPSRTLTWTPTKSEVIPLTETYTLTPSELGTPTWTNTPVTVMSSTLTPTVPTPLPPTQTDTPTLTLTASASVTNTPTRPSRTPTLGAMTTPGRNTLPNTGASEQEIADMTATATPTIEPTKTPARITLDEGCVLHSVLLEVGAGYDTLTFHCPSVLKGVKPQGVGKVD